jgi:hypothetical protein
MSGACIPEACRHLVRRARAAGWAIEHLARHLRRISPDGGSRHRGLLARWPQERQERERQDFRLADSVMYGRSHFHGLKAAFRSSGTIRS